MRVTHGRKFGHGLERGQARRHGRLPVPGDGENVVVDGARAAVLRLGVEGHEEGPAAVAVLEDGIRVLDRFAGRAAPDAVEDQVLVVLAGPAPEGDLGEGLLRRHAGVEIAPLPVVERNDPDARKAVGRPGFDVAGECLALFVLHAQLVNALGSAGPPAGFGQEEESGVLEKIGGFAKSEIRVGRLVELAGRDQEPHRVAHGRAAFRPGARARRW